MALVRDGNGDSLPDLAAAADVNQLVGIQPVAVNDCVAKSFPERQFDGGFLARDAMGPLDEPHQPFH